MNRRTFLNMGAAIGTATALSPNTTAADGGGQREYYELRRYEFDPGKPEQRERLENFFKEAAIPALNRIGIKPVGVFTPKEGENPPLYVLLPHPSLESVATLMERLAQDREFLQAGENVIDATSERPAYKRIESSLMKAFTGLPKLETPIKAPGRVLQLRIYESPTEKTGLKKIEMFNDAGEIRIFREVGLRPVFFGQTLVGDRIPNLTYMLAFESEEQLKENWNKFRSYPDWLKLKAMPEYADKAILSGITNILLKPAEYSQI